MVSVPVILSLIFAEILGDIACPLSILLRGLEALWSPWIGISAPYTPLQHRRVTTFDD